MHCIAYTGLLVVGGEQNGESQSTARTNETAAAATAHTSSHSSGKQQQQSTQRAPAFLGFAVNVEPLQGILYTLQNSAALHCYTA
jgi:hypothetical protein